MNETEDTKHVCDSICEEFGCTDDAEKNHELDIKAKMRIIREVSSNCTLYMDLTYYDKSMTQDYKTKVWMGVFEAGAKHNLLSDELKEEVLIFTKELIKMDSDIKEKVRRDIERSKNVSR